MIFLVSKNVELFQDSRYEIITPDVALNLLQGFPIDTKYGKKLIGADTETEGLDVFTKKLLTIQLGNKDFQVVWDCLSYSPVLLKSIFEDEDVLTIWWNFLFDGKFLFHVGILPQHVYDGMLGEQLLYNGYPAGMHSYSLKSAGITYCNIELDKSVRGQIITKGLTPDVVVYAANDVKYEPEIFEKQLIELEKKDLVKAVKFENEFVKALVYIEYCGVKMDVPRWKKKMADDQARATKWKEELDKWVVKYYKDHQGEDCLYIKERFIWESQVDYAKACTFAPTSHYIPIGPKENVYIPSDGHSVGVRQTIQWLKIEYPFVKVDYQGDLFTGFDTEPHCIINWASPKQVIPLFELLGFNLETFDKKTKQKKKSVDSKIIESQINVSPIAKIYLNYKEAQKVVESFGQNFLDAINPVTKRIHADFHQLGADTCRLSCGGGEAGVNLQQLPHDAETRACFIAEKGNKWISADYQSQESRIIASTANDKAMIELFLHGCGDVHSLTAKMSYPDIIGDCPVEDIKKKFHEQRQDAKGIEFAINYGGDFNTIANNKGIPKEEAKVIYDNYMKGFPGVKRYQDYCRQEVMRRGYILLNPVTCHKAYIYDWDELSKVQEDMKDPAFWAYYKEMKQEDPQSYTVQSVRNYMKRKAASEKQSINYRIQNRGAMCFKLFSIKLYNYLKKNNLLNVVKYCIPVHDEANLECPAEMAEKIAKILCKCMEEGAKPFCTRIPLGADYTIEDHWVH